MKLGFVILNYGTYVETDECIQSIFMHIDLHADEYVIVIVDNGSEDDSLLKLKQKYNDDKIVQIISTGQNLGFANGNNYGIAYVNENFSPDFVVVLNSDTELFQDDFYKKVLTEYEHSGFGLLGPMMCIASGHCDDSPWEPITVSTVEKRLAYYKKINKRIKNRTIYLFKLAEKIKSLFIKSAWVDSIHVHREFWKYQTDVELQGAFLVFSKELLTRISGFDDRTFLYYEEQLLYLKVKRIGLPIVYDPRIAVYHKDGRSTQNFMRASKEKLQFLTKCNIESLEVLLKELKENNKWN